MRLSGTAVELSASDLSQSLSCRHLTALNLAVALGRRSPPSWRDPVLVVLQQRGLDHERGYVDGLRAQKLIVVDLSNNEATTLLRILSTQCGRALMSSFNLPFATVGGLAGPTCFDASRDRAHLVSGRMR